MQYTRYGCKTNQYESNAIIQEFIKNGYKKVNFEDKADVYIVNTCTVTNISDRKSRQILRRAKQKNKDAILVATGCYAQIAKNALKEIKEVDIILGNEEKKDVFCYVKKFQKERQEKIADISKKTNYLEFRKYNLYRKNKSIH